MSQESTSDIYAVVMRKNADTFVFIFNDRTVAEAKRRVGMMASSELDFSWYDAAMLSQEINKATRSV